MPVPARQKVQVNILIGPDLSPVEGLGLSTSLDESAADLRFRPSPAPGVASSFAFSTEWLQGLADFTSRPEPAVVREFVSGCHLW